MLTRLSHRAGAPTHPVPTLSPRAFVRAFMVSTVACCLTLAAFNYAVNPLGWYAPRLVRPLSWGDQRIKIDQMKVFPAAGAMVLGSSRVLTLSPDEIKNLTGLTAYNAGVSSSRPEEQYAMLRYALDDLHWPVKEIIYGLDAETLFYAGAPNGDLVSSPEIRRYVPVRMWGPEMLSRFELLLSTYNLDLSVKALRAQSQGPAPETITFDADGRVRYVRMERQIADGITVLKPERNIPDYRQRYDVPADFDPQRLALFEDTFRLAAERGIEVKLFLTPFHPVLLQALQESPQFSAVHAKALAYLSALPERYPNVQFLDLTDISSFGANPNDFYDGVHYRPDNASLLLKRLFAGQGAKPHAVQ